MNTPATEDYLRAIYELATPGGWVSTSQIAAAMEVRPASVTGMIQKLATAEPPLLEYHKHHGVALTAEGRQAALEVLRHHRLLEVFLHDVLGFAWDAVHDEADRLEHVISEEFERRVDAMLGYPTRDPHGEPIPDSALQMPADAGMLLSALLPGQHGSVQRIDEESAEFLRYVSRLGLTPGARLTVLEYSPVDGNLHLSVDGQPGTVVVGKLITERITVQVEGDEDVRT